MFRFLSYYPAFLQLPRHLDPAAPSAAHMASLPLPRHRKGCKSFLRTQYIPTTASTSHVRAPASCQRDAFRHVYRDIKRSSRVISVGVQSAVFHRRESECDKNRGPPAEALHRRSCRWTPVSPVLICKETPYHRGLPFPTCLCSGLMWGTKESFATNNLQSGRNLSGCNSR